MPSLRHVLCLALVVLVAQALPAAVNCRNPRNRQQRVVCANPDLMDLDQQVSRVYEKALANAPGSEHKQFEYDQASWEVGSGGCWDRVDCIEKRYTDRIAALEALVSKASATSPSQPSAADSTLQAPATSSPTPPETEAVSAQSPQPAPPVERRTQSATETTPPAAPSATGLEQTKQDETASNSNGWNWLTTFGLLLVVGVPLIYLTPTIVAFSRKHRNRWAIAAINLVFGATLVGWVIALIWALNKIDDPIKGGIKFGPQPHDPVL